MKTLTIEVEESTAKLWQKLPATIRQSITAHALSAFLNGTLYPVGEEQLELAIELAEAGVDAEIISKLTRLDISSFSAFLKK